MWLHSWTESRPAQRAGYMALPRRASDNAVQLFLGIGLVCTVHGVCVLGSVLEVESVQESEDVVSPHPT
jgi:hypothetical protein